MRGAPRRSRVTAPGFTSTQGNVNVVAPALQIESLASSISATAASDIFQVRVGIADSFNNTRDASPRQWRQDLLWSRRSRTRRQESLNS